VSRVEREVRLLWYGFVPEDEKNAVEETELFTNLAG